MEYWKRIPDKEVVKEGVELAFAALRRHVQARPKETWVGLSVAAASIFIWKYGQDFRHRYFAWINNKFNHMKPQEYEDFKHKVFTCLKDLTSHDPKLKEEKSLRILEIGAGIGANFDLYPNNTRLIVADPNPYFEKYFSENKANFPNIKIETIIVAKGEDIDMVESNSVDVVVTTLVLCSVTDMPKVISQIKRVLVPDGKYIFVEHVHEWDRNNHRIRRFLQGVLTVTGFWPFIFDGCHLNRNPLPVIDAVGFSNVSSNQDYAPLPVWWMKVAQPHLRGVATK